MSPALLSGLLLLAAVIAATVGAWLLLPAAGWLTMGAGLAYMSWSINRPQGERS